MVATEPNLFAHLLTTSPLDTPQVFTDVLTRLCRHVALPMPYLFGEGEPPTTPWDLQTLPSITRQIVRPTNGWYHWQRAAGQECGQFSVGTPHLHSLIGIRAATTPSLAASYIRFIREESVVLKADLAFVHISHEDRPLRQDEPEYVMRLGPSTVQFRRGLPDLPWATVFGQPYVDMFGRAKLLSTPAAEVSEIGGGSIYVQLTDTCDVNANADLERFRNAAKTHLGIDAFRDSGKARVPAFNLQPPPARGLSDG